MPKREFTRGRDGVLTDTRVIRRIQDRLAERWRMYAVTTDDSTISRRDLRMQIVMLNWVLEEACGIDSPSASQPSVTPE